MGATDDPRFAITRWVAQAHGEPAAVLRLENADSVAEVPAGHARVALGAIGLNWADVLTCRGTYQVRCEPPFVPGLEAAGAVKAVGAGVDPAWVGRSVCLLATPPAGAFTSVVDVPVAQVMPTAADPQVAAAMLVNYHTAHVALTRRVHLAPGSTVLVHAAAGGTGGAAVQVARALGADVIATCRGADKADVARAHGAQHVIDLGATDGEFREAVLERTAGRGVDVVFDPVGGPSFDQTRRIVAWEGSILIIGAAGGPPTPPPLGHVLVKNYSLVGVHWSAYATRDPEVLRSTQAALDGWLATGAIAPLISSVRPFREIPVALSDLAAGNTVGKVVIAL